MTQRPDDPMHGTSLARLGAGLLAAAMLAGAPATIHAAGAKAASEQPAEHAANAVVVDDDTARALRHLGVHRPEAESSHAEGGLLAIAKREAAIADRHLVLAEEATDRFALERHLAQAMHALNPAAVPDGPGLGYGLVRAARDGTAEAYRLGLMAAPGTALDGTAARIATAFTNLATWGRDAAILARQAGDAPTLDQGKRVLERLRRLTSAMIDGRDADGDGTVEASFGEAGLEQAQAAFAAALEARGLSRDMLGRVETQEQQTQEGG